MTKQDVNTGLVYSVHPSGTGEPHVVISFINNDHIVSVRLLPTIHMVKAIGPKGGAKDSKFFMSWLCGQRFLMPFVPSSNFGRLCHTFDNHSNITSFGSIRDDIGIDHFDKIVKGLMGIAIRNLTTLNAPINKWLEAFMPLTSFYNNIEKYALDTLHDSVRNYPNHEKYDLFITGAVPNLVLHINSSTMSVNVCCESYVQLLTVPVLDFMLRIKPVSTSNDARIMRFFT